MQRIGCIRLTPAESAVYDSGNDIAGRELSDNLKARARATLAAGAWQVEIVHAAGFVAWVYERADFGGAL
jgi:hypothetical protein